MPSAQYRHIGPWTINNPTEDDFTKVRSAVENGYCKYVVFCHENKDREGYTYHLQGYAQAKTGGNYTMKKWHEVLGARFATGHKPNPNDVEATINYCKGLQKNKETGKLEQKEGSAEVEEFGAPNAPGQRSDLLKAKAYMDEGHTFFETQNTEEHFVCCIQNHNAMEKYARQRLEMDARKRRLATYDNTEWKPWQAGILDMIDQTADARTVNWLYDQTGNIGKSYLSTYLGLQGKAYCPDVTKIADIFYGYQHQPIVIFDIPRSKQEHMEHLYTAMEQFKNGRIFISKYESHEMYFKPPHVIVFANFKPQMRNDKDELTLSMDRWCIIPLHLPIKDVDSFKRMREHAMETDTHEQITKKRKVDHTQENTTHWL